MVNLKRSPVANKPLIADSWYLALNGQPRYLLSYKNRNLHPNINYQIFSCCFRLKFVMKEGSIRYIWVGVGVVVDASCILHPLTSTSPNPHPHFFLPSKECLWQIVVFTAIHLYTFLHLLDSSRKISPETSRNMLSKSSLMLSSKICAPYYIWIDLYKNENQENFHILLKKTNTVCTKIIDNHFIFYQLLITQKLWHWT